MRFQFRTVRWISAHLLLGVLVSGASRGVSTAETIAVPRSEALTADDEESLQSGWIAQFTSPGQAVDYRVVRLAALYVADGEPTTTFIGPGRFRVTFSGWLDVELPGRYAFRPLGRGTVALSINGAAILQNEQIDIPTDTSPKWVQLPGGMQRVELTYESPADGDALIRLMWRGETFGEEPLPPDRMFHDAGHVELQAHQQLRRGRELLAELHCLRCHAGGNAIELPEDAHTRDVLLRLAPQLVESRIRFQSNWLFHWLLDPQALRADARMPRLAADRPEDERRQTAADIVAFLTGGAASSPDDAGGADTAEDVVATGRRHFESLGCIACHRLSGPAADDLYNRISLEHAAQKFPRGQLAAYLLDPQRHDPWRAMPNFRLSDAEAGALEGFLRAAVPGPGKLPTPAELAKADAARGARALIDLGCVACHGPVRPEGAVNRSETVRQIPLAADALDRGCLAETESARAGSPRFRLTELDAQALRRFLRSGMMSSTQDELSESAERLVAQLRCAHCHPRDGWTSVWPEVLAEEGSQGKLAETVPSLTWAGEKLQVAWATRLIAGDPATRARPWLEARMPAFPAYAATLAHGFARQHGFSAKPRLGPAPPRDYVELGARLAGRSEGFFCCECHAIGAEPAVGAFAHHGVNFDQVGRRLNYDYFLRWITQPARVDPGTKMPTFSPDGSRTTKTQLLEGRAPDQFQAIWHYLRSLAQEDADGRQPNAEAAGTRTHD